MGCLLLLERYASSRPYLYHLTHRSNLQHISQLRRLFPAATLLEHSGNAALMRTPRRGPKPVIFQGRTIIICDQDRLHEANAGLPRGYTFSHLLGDLNKRIFFWPGTSTGPIEYGVRHFARYADQRPVVLRVGFESLRAVNPRAIPLFCRYNSGSPRCIPPHGKKSPRGPDTFIDANDFDGQPGQVVE